jgi:anti-sigma factor RsiW
MNHSETWDLIPWFLNGRASAEQCAQVERHLEQCAHCREELAAQRSLMQAMRTRPTVESMPHASLQKLWTRIDGGSGTTVAAPVATEMPRRRRPGLTGWLAVAVVAQALLLGVLAMFMLDRPGTGDEASTYHTVSTPAAAPTAGAVRAVFAPEMRLGELQALLERAHLHIVNGPSAEGVLTLALAASGDDAAQALTLLRAHPATRFAEPIGH